MLFKLYVDKISQECGSLCHRMQELNALSPFRRIAVDQFPTFQWVSLIRHLSVKAPHLLSLFSEIVSHSDHRNQNKADSVHFPGLCMATAILLKERNREMCGIQSLISTLLYNSHVEKQVCAHPTCMYAITLTTCTGLCTFESCWSELESHWNTQSHG